MFSALTPLFPESYFHSCLLDSEDVALKKNKKTNEGKEAQILSTSPHPSHLGSGEISQQIVGEYEQRLSE